MNRALRAATVGVLLLSPVVLSACSAGQVTQTATQERDKVGAMAQVGDLTIRAVRLVSPSGGSYDSGDDAELQLAIVNDGDEPDALVGISGEGFGDVEFDSGTTATASPTPTSGSSSSSDDKIEIPAHSTVFIGTDGASVTLTDLDRSLTTGQYLELTFEFERAGEVTLPVTVATPDESVERGEAFDFHQEEGEPAHE
ncbi:MAG: copper chaperone PCu(A)C [Cellulomonas sp.]